MVILGRLLRRIFRKTLGAKPATVAAPRLRITQRRKSAGKVPDILRGSFGAAPAAFLAARGLCVVCRKVRKPCEGSHERRARCYCDHRRSRVPGGNFGGVRAAIRKCDRARADDEHKGPMERCRTIDGIWRSHSAATRSAATDDTIIRFFPRRDYAWRCEAELWRASTDSKQKPPKADRHMRPSLRLYDPE